MADQKNPFSDPNFGAKEGETNTNPFSNPDFGKRAPDKGFGGHLRDSALSLAKGVIAVPEAAVGIADIPTGGRVGKFLENESGMIGFRPARAREMLSDLHTDKYKEQQQDFAEADGIVNKTKSALSNPSTIVNTVIESVPSIFGGGVAGRGAVAAGKKTGLIKSPTTASQARNQAIAGGAIGEGAVMAGAQASAIRDETEDGLLTAGQSLASLGTGVAGSLFGWGGGRLAQKLGIGDVDTMVVSGRATPGQIAEEIATAPAKSVPRKIIEGAVTEGFLEELPQSVSEQIIQNLALGKEWHEGVEDAAVMGTLAGMAMGGTIAPFGGQRAVQAQDQGQQETLGLPPPMDASGAAEQSPPIPQPPQSPTPDRRPDSQPLPSERMGLNPADGPLSDAAASAVDTGASQQLTEQISLQEAAAAAESAPKNRKESPEETRTSLNQAGQAQEEDGFRFDPNTGEIINRPGIAMPGERRTSSGYRVDPRRTGEFNLTPEESAAASSLSSRRQELRNQGVSEQSPEMTEIDQQLMSIVARGREMQERPENLGGEQATQRISEIQSRKLIQERLDGINKQGRSAGWDPLLVAARDRLQNQLSSIGTQDKQAASQQATQQPEAAAPTMQDWDTMPTKDRVALAQSALKLRGVVAKAQAAKKWEQLTPSAREIIGKVTGQTSSQIVDSGASAAATSATNDTPAPSEAQIEAGNYKKGHVKVSGLDISIENPRGSVRSGTDRDGNQWSHEMSDHYGYIRGTTGADGEHVDTYVGQNPDSDKVFIVDQINQDSGTFDEHKVMIGYDSLDQAISAYQSNFDAGWQVGPVTEMNANEFKDWLKSGDTSSPLSQGEINPQPKESTSNQSAAPGTMRELQTQESLADTQQKENKNSRALDLARQNDIMGESSPQSIKMLTDLLNADSTVRLSGSLTGNSDSNGNLLPEWSDAGNGFSARQYVWDNRAYQEIRSPSGAIAQRSMGANGVPSADISANATIEDIISGAAFSEFGQFFSDRAQPSAQALPPGSSAASETEQPKNETTAEDRFSKNKLITSAAVEAARARIKSKLGRANSGYDPEMLVDGMTIAGAYIESGIRDFAQYAKLMVDDMGDGIKPYLLAFWDGARRYPGLDTEGMTSHQDSERLFNEMISADDIATDAVGNIDTPKKKKSRKSGTSGDMVLTQSWGVEHVDGYGDSDRETGNSTKDAFIKESRNYLNAVAERLSAAGFAPYKNAKGKDLKPVSVNESGVATSGDISIKMVNDELDIAIYANIGGTSLRGVVPHTESGIAIMYRTGPAGNEYLTNADNNWAQVDLSANDFADMLYEKATQTINKSGKSNERPSTENGRESGAAPVRTGRGPSQPGAAQGDTGILEAGQPADGGQTSEAGDSGRSSVRVSRENVAGGQAVPGQRNADDGRTRASGTRSPDAGDRESGINAPQAEPAAEISDAALTPVDSPAATAVQAQDLHISNPLEIVGGTPVQRFNKNRQALELLQELEEDGRQATPEEQRVLAGYIGWGSFGQELFQGTWESPVYKDEGAWRDRGEWLRENLGESAWKSAQRSITNAHYTDPPTVMAMWDMARRLGFTGGKVSEPSMGTGNFFSMMPQDIKSRSQLTGIELDETTGRIAKQLFPKSNIQIMGYQDSQTPDGFYDIVIGNWPFENTPVADRRYNKLNPMLHDYFFLKALDQVRPGGIVIGITSAGSMDKQNTTIRREMAKKAELLSSIRLPSGAFEQYAGTKVVTDIVVLRKRPERLVLTPKENWIETAMVKTPSGEDVRVNQYYAENPQNIIGTLDHGHGTTTFRAGMLVHRPDNMEQRLKDAVNLVPENAIAPRQILDTATYYANRTGERHGSLGIVEGKLMVAMGDQLVDANNKVKYQVKDPKETSRREAELKDLIGVRQLRTTLADAERANQDDAEKARKALKSGYDAFVKKHGSIRDSWALTYLNRLEDPFYADMAALENDDGKPAAVLTKSTTRGARGIENPTVSDAYIIARNNSVNPSIDEIAKIAGKPADKVRSELLGKGAVFEEPNGDITPSDIYLSGNVRVKMREAQAALEAGNKSMQRNVDALAEVMPEDVPYFNIETKLGATWVSPDAYVDFISSMLSRENTKGINVSFRSGRWKVALDSTLNQLPEAKANYGSEFYPFSKLVQAAMSNQVLRLNSTDSQGNTFYDAKKSEEVNSRIAKIREDFSQWLWSKPERRVAMEQEYNESRNAWATPKYDGSFMTMEGMALSLGDGPFDLRNHQRNAIWRAVVNRRSLNAHEVGTGKTFTMGGIAIESRRYGIAKKPLLFAHNANSATVAKEIRMMYPDARILYLGSLEPKTRAVRLRQIANDDWDLIVVPHSLIDRFSLKEETLMQMAADDIRDLESEFYEAAKEDGVNTKNLDLDDDESIAKIRSTTAKELAKSRKRIIENIKKQAQQSSKEDAVSFEDMGVDMILVDEAHEFKKPPIVTRMRMKGLNTDDSAKSIAMQFLTRYVRNMNNGGNVHTFTGTPITNTITEIYHQMRYVMESEMEQAGVSDWDGWFGSFATEVQDVELTAAGEYEMVTRLAGFVNVPELRLLAGRFMDTVFAEDMPEMKPRTTASGKVMTDPTLTESERAELLNGRTEGAKDRPYKKVINASADMTAEQLTVFEQLQEYARDFRNATGKERRELMRSGDPRSPIVTEGIASKASLDVRLIKPEFAGMEGQTNDDPNSKASRVVNNVMEIYRSHPQANQVIFSDSGFGKSVRRSKTRTDGSKTSETVKVFSTMYDIVERLVQAGIPRSQIAMVTGSTSKDKRREIAEGMNNGRIRVAIGSTDTLGVGTNMQRNLRAMHHLDAPWMPGELEQRNGRGQRQGNQWNTVLEYRYMTDRLDGRRWQILAVKQRFINAFMKSSNNARIIEGEAAADEQSDILESFSEAAGDPRILQRVKLTKKQDNLYRKERLYSQGISDMARQAKYSENRAEKIQGRIDEIEANEAVRKTAELLESQRNDFTAVIDGTTFDKRKDAIEALNQWLNENARGEMKKTVVGSYRGIEMYAYWPMLSQNPEVGIEAFGQTFEGKGIAGLEAVMRNFPTTVERDEQEVIDNLRTSENMRRSMSQPFAQEAELERVEKQLSDLEKDLAMNPVPPPAWLRQGAPIDTEVFRSGKPFVVVGHQYGNDGWFVLAEDEKGSVSIPYMDAKDQFGVNIYDEREFTPPNVVKQSAKEEDKTPEPQFSFGGAQAANADTASLYAANRRINRGESPEKVRRDTGWFRGDDGRWRFEISDRAASIIGDGNTFGEILENSGVNATVGSILSHDRLYEAYPEIRNIKIGLAQPGDKATARYRRTAEGEFLLVKPNVKRSALRSILMHEIQHGIQRIEGFARGGNPASAIGGENAYRRMAGEVEARNVQTRIQMDDAQRAAISPGLTRDVSASDVIVSFNGKDVVSAPKPENAKPPYVLTADGLIRAFNLQYPKLTGAVEKMLARGAAGQRGGLVMISSNDPAEIARQFAQKTGRNFSSSLKMMEGAGVIRGFYDDSTGLTFLVGPNLDPVTGPAVLLHEAVHTRQRAGIDQKAYSMLMERGRLRDEKLKSFLDRVARRMVDAGETSNPAEAAAYIVEQAIIEGPESYRTADGRFLTWVDNNIGKRVGDIIRGVLASVRQFAMRNGIRIGAISVDDLVRYASEGVQQAASGKTARTEGGAEFSRSPVGNPDITATPAFREWFGDSKVVDAEGTPLVVYHGSKGNITSFDSSLTGKNTATEHEGFFFTSSTEVAGDFASHPGDLISQLSRYQERLQELQDDVDSASNREAISEDDFFSQIMYGDAREDSATEKEIASLKKMIKDTQKQINQVMNSGAAGASIYPAYLSLKNPLVVDFKRKTKGGLTIDYVDQLDDVINRAKAAGHDGVIARNTHDSPVISDPHDVYVAFKNTQIKSAIGNTGAFDGGNPDIRFSRSGAPTEGEAKNYNKVISDAIGSVTVPNIKQLMKNKATDLMGIGLQFVGRRQLVDLYSKILPQLNEYDRLVAKMEAEKNDTGAKSDELATKWGKLKDGKELADLMHDATLEGKDAATAQFGDLKQRYAALSPEAKAVYLEARDSYRQHHKEVLNAIKDRIERSELRGDRKKELLKKMDDEFYAAVKGVYFPLSRFGQYVVSVKNPSGAIISVQRAETIGEANNLREHLLKSFPESRGFTVGKVTLSKEFVANRDSVGRGFMTELYTALDDINLPTNTKMELEDTLGQLYLSSLPDLSWAKHGLHRKGTPGFSDDARRAFAQNMFHGARYLAKLRYGDMMQTQLEDMQKHADANKDNPNYDQPKAQRVIDEMGKRHDTLMNPNSNPLSTALTSFGFVYYLGLSPAAAVVNLSQTALVAYPIMGAKWGFKKSGEALLKASNQAVAGKNDITKSLTANEKHAFDRAVKDGTIDVTMAHDLANIAQGEDAKILWKIRPVMKAASFLFHQAEVFNRQVTFIASYRLAKETGVSDNVAYEQARKATYDGHFDYSSGNRPRAMQGNVAKVVLLFKQYAQNMVYTMARNAYQSVAGESPEVRREARKVFGAIMLLHASAAGVLGLPFVGTLLAAASALGGSDDEPWDAEAALRNMLAETLGKDASEVIARGFSRLTPWDISGRVSLEGLIFPNVQEGIEGRRLAEAWTTALLGPVVGVATNTTVGLQHIAEGRYSMGIESILPIALRNPIKAIRYFDEGVVDRSGIIIQDEVGIAGLLGQASGFSPSDVRLSFEGKQAIHRHDRRLNERRQELMTEFARASMDGDTQGMQDARAKIKLFNELNPQRRIQGNHLMQSVRNRKRRIADAESGVYLPRKRRDALEAGSFAFD